MTNIHIGHDFDLNIDKRLNKLISYLKSGEYIDDHLCIFYIDGIKDTHYLDYTTNLNIWEYQGNLSDDDYNYSCITSGINNMLSIVWTVDLPPPTLIEVNMSKFYSLISKLSKKDKKCSYAHMRDYINLIMY